MKTFEVRTTGSGHHTAAQLATFTHYVLGIQYRFVVTRIGVLDPVVTHRLSGLKFCAITPANLAKARYDWRTAGKLAVAERLKQVGEAFAKARLDEAEAGHRAA